MLFFKLRVIGVRVKYILTLETMGTEYMKYCSTSRSLFCFVLFVLFVLFVRSV